MKLFAPLLALVLVARLSAAEVPTIFAGLLEPDVPIKGQIGKVMPPPEIDKYHAKINAARRKDPEWFREFLLKTKPGEVLPFDERLGLTKEEYADYVALWDKREFKVSEEVMLLLRQSGSGTWTITATGGASVLSTLRYVAKDDLFRSPNGDLAKLGEIKTEADGILGAWNGLEWKFEEETGLGKTKENFAIGRFEDNKFGLLVYHAMELSTKGTPLMDKSLVVRFALGKAGQIKPRLVKPATKPAAKPAAKK